MSTGPNDTTKFELAFLILWLIGTVAVLALVFMRKLALPTVLRGNPMFPMIFAVTQFVIFVLFLAAMAYDGWSKLETTIPISPFFSYTVKIGFGVAGTHKVGSQDGYTRYDCSSYSDTDAKNMCGTAVAAGAFVLIFGLFAIILAFALMLATLGGAFNIAPLRSMLAPLNRHLGMLFNVQWICFLFMFMIWGISAHDIIRQTPGEEDVKLDASWALTFVCFFLAVACALYYGDKTEAPGAGAGAGATASGETSAVPATTSAGVGQSAPEGAVAVPIAADQSTVVVQPAPQ